MTGLIVFIAVIAANAVTALLAVCMCKAAAAADRYMEKTLEEECDDGRC